MNEIDMLTADRVIEGIEFSGDKVMIRFFEGRNIRPAVQITNAMVLHLNEDTGALVDRVMDLLGDLLDEGYITLRDPPKRFSPNEARQAILDAEDDEQVQ